jgi:hypothetical protein
MRPLKQTHSPLAVIAPCLLIVGAALGQEPSTTEFTRVEVQANSFTRSTQDGVTLAGDPAGGTLLAWQSRRQQGGTYGIYARRFGPDGVALSGEVQVNATTRGHQMLPVVALDDGGGAWFAWRSFGQDGSLGTIVARRFDPTLTTATAEVIVNGSAAGHQTNPAIVALPGGGALVAWLDPGEGDHHALRARRLNGAGELDGEPFVVSDNDFGHGTPVLAVDGERVLVAYARFDGQGRPAGLFVRTITGEKLSPELRLDVAGGVYAIEPALAANGGQILAGWLESERGGYGLRVRSLSLQEHPQEHPQEQRIVPGPVREITGDLSGWRSGVALALDGVGGGLITWNQHADGPKGLPGLFARRLDGASGKPQGDAFRATTRIEGKQAQAVGTPGAKCALWADGRMAFAWQGDAGPIDGDLVDDSAANLTLVTPAGMALAAAPTPAPVTGLRFEDPSTGAARPSHDPPTFDPRNIERDRSEQESPAAGGVFDFLGFVDTGWTPPDPEMAVGPDHIVAMVNGGIAWFLKDGTLQFQQDINGAGGFWGSVGASSFVFDPEVVFDVHSQRFVAFASDFNNGLLLAVSDDADPNGTWNKYLIDSSTIFGVSFVDSTNLAVDDEVITLTGDVFSPDRLVMIFVDKASAMAGGPLVSTTQVITGRQSMGTCTNLDPGPQPLFLTWAEEFVAATTLRLYAVTNRLTSPVVQSVTLTVPQYSHPADPPQLGTSVRPELFEARFWSSMVVGGHLWAVHHEGASRARVQWYEFDLGSWPAAGSPSLIQSGEVDLGAGIYTFFPSIWADGAGNAAITFNRSSANEFISIQMVTRSAGNPPGTMSAPELVRNGASPDVSGRFGDYSATNHDPVAPGSFWGHHEYRGAGAWRTRIARIDLCVGSATNYCTTSPNSAGAGAVITTSGTSSISANDLVLEVSRAPAGQFGLFFFGDQQQSTPLGDGTLCVGGAFQRFPVVAVDGVGTASFAPDLANLPGGVTLSPGDTQNFQFWYRDTGFGNAEFNLSDAVSVVFCD